MIHRVFSLIARKTADWIGTPGAFLLATLSVVFWAVTGPLFDYSDTWQLVINTSTTVVTFLVVFLLQYTQSQDTLEIKTILRELARQERDVDESVVREAVSAAIDDPEEV